MKSVIGNVITGVFFRLILAVVFLAASAGAQAGFQEGMKAYVTGNYPVALKEFKALAIKGNAVAQFWLGWMYNDASTYKPIYGALYNWYAVSDVRNIAPAGWHVSSDDEWKLMEIYLDVTSAITNPNGWEGTDVSGKLKETCFTYWPSPNEGASNSSGFTALPGGFRRDGGAFFTFGVDGLFWTSTEADVSRAWYRRLFYGYANVFRNQDEKWGGFSVRCVRD